MFTRFGDEGNCYFWPVSHLVNTPPFAVEVCLRFFFDRPYRFWPVVVRQERISALELGCHSAVIWGSRLGTQANVLRIA